MIALIDGRQDLYKNNSLLHYFPLMEPQAGFDDINLLDITAMAAKIAYENPAYIENTVTNHWKVIACLRLLLLLLLFVCGTWSDASIFELLHVDKD